MSEQQYVFPGYSQTTQNLLEGILEERSHDYDHELTDQPETPETPCKTQQSVHVQQQPQPQRKRTEIKQGTPQFLERFKITPSKKRKKSLHGPSPLVHCMSIPLSCEDYDAGDQEMADSDPYGLNPETHVFWGDLDPNLQQQTLMDTFWENSDPNGALQSVVEITHHQYW
uniref:Uncharacterized protein n=1 Tax=viral metagenome TaxID=1070528 RepID=A0A6C0EAW2_9ZZZZ